MRELCIRRVLTNDFTNVAAVEEYERLGDWFASARLGRGRRSVEPRVGLISPSNEHKKKKKQKESYTSRLISSILSLTYPTPPAIWHNEIPLDRKDLIRTSPRQLVSPTLPLPTSCNTLNTWFDMLVGTIEARANVYEESRTTTVTRLDTLQRGPLVVIGHVVLTTQM